MSSQRTQCALKNKSPADLCFFLQILCRLRHIISFQQIQHRHIQYIGIALRLLEMHKRSKQPQKAAWPAGERAGHTGSVNCWQ
ncbi:conserved protein of unknown function [Cupriavidus taiwanensis]|nr:conserved protein of unknown function [Cupriavidus taiwanensis]